MVLPSAVVAEPPSDSIAEGSTAEFSESVQAQLDKLRTGVAENEAMDVDQPAAPTPVVETAAPPIAPVREVSERKIEEVPAAPTAPKPTGKVSR